jgi:membrane-associated protein
VQFLLAVLTGRASLDELVLWGGYAILAAIVFAETGLLVGCFLPGDSLLITAGLLAAAGHFDISVLMAMIATAAIAGDSVGYGIGSRAGPRLFSRPKSRFFSPQHAHRTREFYDRHGAKTIVLARFVPIIRTFAPVIAGVAAMDYRRFLTYNVAGGILWTVSMTGAGYLLGRTIPNVNAYIHIIVLVVIVLSIVPIAIELLRERRRKTLSSRR